MSIVKLNNRGVRSATTVGSVTVLGQLIFLKKVTASSSGDVSFVNGASSVVLDTTYKEYIFTFKNIHPGNDNVSFQFNGSDDTSSHSYNITKTTTVFNHYHNEADTEYALGYRSADDVAQGTGYHTLMNQVSNDADANIAGYLHLFEPSNTTFVKHFIAKVAFMATNPGSRHDFMAGYCNVTAAIDGVDFKFSSGNIDSGVIKMFGLSKS